MLGTTSADSKANPGAQAFTRTPPAAADPTARPASAARLRADSIADMPGLCELPLTRAVVQYRDVHEIVPALRAGSDIGLAVVVSGRFASSVRAVDLGSGAARFLDLSSELVILNWVQEAVVARLGRLDRATHADPEAGDRLRRYGFGLALRILGRHGFTPVTRSTLLRIGFLDICGDLDPEGRAEVRIDDGARSVVRARLDCDSCALVFRFPRPGSGRPMERIVQAAFPGRRMTDGHRIPLGIPATFADLTACLRVARRGLGALIAHFEPERHRELRRLVDVFGERATLHRLGSTAARSASEPNGWPHEDTGASDAAMPYRDDSAMSIH